MTVSHTAPLRLSRLPDRAIVSVSGPDRVSFLQGLVSNDVARCPPGEAIWCAFLTAQGKYLADFFVINDLTQERLLLDCEATQAQMLVPRLSRYRLRANVVIAPVALEIVAAWTDPTDTQPDWPPLAPDSLTVADPRSGEAGWRIICESLPALNADFAAYEKHRIVLGLPDGARDCEADKTLLLEANFDRLNGISWTKGCYMGQELTARTRYRGLVRRKLIPVEFDGTVTPGTPIMAGEKEVGVIRSVSDTHALAMLRTESFDQSITAGDIPLHVKLSHWAQ